MLTFHNDPAIKANLLAHMKAHYDADEIIQGNGWENGKGCFVGCTFDSYDHSLFPLRLGLPEWLAYLCDIIFEGLPNDRAKEFARDFYANVPVGVDISKVQNQFKIWLLIDPGHGCINNASDDGKVAIKAVADLLYREMNDEEVTEPESAAAWAARTESAAAAAAAARAAVAAAAARATRTARTAAYISMADKLTSLIREAA